MVTTQDRAGCKESFGRECPWLRDSLAAISLHLEEQGSSTVKPAARTGLDVDIWVLESKARTWLPESRLDRAVL